MKFSDSKRFHAKWAEDIVSKLAGIDQQDDSHCGSLPYILASKDTYKLGEHFELTYHLSKQNRHADERSKETYRMLGNNTLFLVNPIVVIKCQDNETGDVFPHTMRLKYPAPVPIQYVDIDIAETVQVNNDGMYFGPHVIGALSFKETVRTADFELSAGIHDVVIPFYGLEVASTQPVGKWN